MDGMPEDLTNDDLEFFKYVPLSSVNVEQIFSKYKTLFLNNCHRFKFENIRKWPKFAVQYSM